MLYMFIYSFLPDLNRMLKCCTSCHREGKTHLKQVLIQSKDASALCCEPVHVHHLVETCFPSALHSQLNTFHPAATSIDDLQHMISDQYLYFREPVRMKMRILFSYKASDYYLLMNTQIIQFIEHQKIVKNSSKLIIPIFNDVFFTGREY